MRKLPLINGLNPLPSYTNMNISKFGKGYSGDRIDIRDYRLENIPMSTVLPEKYSLRDKIGKIKNQNGSGSCTSQSSASYAQLLNFIETGEQIELSARYLYSNVYVEPAGSGIVNNLKRIISNGIALESDIPSYYPDRSAPSETFMRKKDDITPEIEEKALTYAGKKYFTWSNKSLDMYKKAIILGNGALIASWGDNDSWQYKNIKIPKKTDWRHVVLLTGYDDKNKVFEFVNSWGNNWGDGGFGHLPYEYVEKGLISAAYTYTDLPNGTYPTLLKVKSILQNLLSLYGKLIELKKVGKK